MNKTVKLIAVLVIIALCVLVIRFVPIDYDVLFSKRTVSVYLNRIFPQYFPSPYAISKEQVQVPKSTQTTDITIIKGVVTRRLHSESPEYEVDASGTMYVIVFDDKKLIDESQHVLLPIGKGYQSIDIKDGYNQNLLCPGEAVTIRALRVVKEGGGGKLFKVLPENVIVNIPVDSCTGRTIQSRKEFAI